jgi:hypothetical protein
MKLPEKRSRDLLSTKLEDEVVIYDPQTKQAHSLNRLAVAVWNNADGSRTVEDLQRLASEETGVAIDAAAVMLALRRLDKAGLLTADLESRKELTRRQVLRKAGQLGAAAMVTPLVASALVPVPAAAASVAGTCTNVQLGCVNNGNCNTNGSCFCYVSAEGGAACAENTSCAAQQCTSSSQCPSGTVCIVNTCCPTGVCAQICPPAGAPGGPISPPGPGMTTNAA